MYATRMIRITAITMTLLGAWSSRAQGTARPVIGALSSGGAAVGMYDSGDVPRCGNEPRRPPIPHVDLKVIKTPEIRPLTTPGLGAARGVTTR